MVNLTLLISEMPERLLYGEPRAYIGVPIGTVVPRLRLAASMSAVPALGMLCMGL